MEDWRCYSVQLGHERSSDKGTFQQRSESSEGVAKQKSGRRGFCVEATSGKAQKRDQA